MKNVSLKGLLRSGFALFPSFARSALVSRAVRAN